MSENGNENVEQITEDVVKLADGSEIETISHEVTSDTETKLKIENLDESYNDPEHGVSDSDDVNLTKEVQFVEDNDKSTVNTEISTNNKKNEETKVPIKSTEACVGDDSRILNLNVTQLSSCGEYTQIEDTGETENGRKLPEVLHESIKQPTVTSCEDMNNIIDYTSPTVEEPTLNLEVNKLNANAEELRSTEAKQLTEELAKLTEDMEKLDKKLLSENSSASDGLKYSKNELDFMDKAIGFLKISVGNPEKTQTPMESYITYEVKTDTDIVEYAARQSTMRRRYQDFVWLKQKLEENHPACIIPPLPSKQAVKGVLDRFSVEFVTKRCVALNQYLNRISTHPKLKKSKALRTFLTLPSTDFSILRKNDIGGISSRFLGLKNMQLNSPREINSEWLTLNQRQEQLSYKMKQLENISEKHCFEISQLQEDLDNVLPILDVWEKKEPNDLSDTLSKLRNSTQKWSKCCSTLNQEVPEGAGNIFREYALFAESVKSLAKRRDSIQVELEGLGDTIKSKQADEISTRLGKFSIAGFISGNEHSRQDKLAKLEVEIRELQSTVVISEDNLKTLEAAAKEELDRYEHNRTLDLAESFKKVASCQAIYYEETATAWRNSKIDTAN